MKFILRTKREIERNIREGTVIAAFLKNDMAVKYHEDDGSVTLTRTRSEPWQLGHGQWVVKVIGKTGGVDCAATSLSAARKRAKQRGWINFNFILTVRTNNFHAANLTYRLLCAGSLTQTQL